MQWIMGFGRRGATRYPDRVSKPEKVLPDPFSTPFSCHRFMAGPYYFLFTAGTNIEVNDSMTDGSSSSGKAIGSCSIYLRGAD